jgi:hypothetical protein
MHVYDWLLVPVRVRCMSRKDTICSRASKNWQSSFGDPQIKLFEFYKVEDPEHPFDEGKFPLTYLCPIHMIIYFPRITLLKPKYWLAFYLPCPWLPFGLLWLALC